ncbi:MAG: GyrI-like domain-containing protein [Proteobacteria bacterium]|nr:GyrI-like domain-containing protein [Pseudomonadota bacterium]
MKQEIVTLEPFEIMGLKVRTSTKDEFNPATAKIGPLIQKFWLENIPNKIPHPKNLNHQISSYSHYENEDKGAYDYLFGLEVPKNEISPLELSSLIIQGGSYVKFTSSPGPMPDIVIQMWQAIWKMSPAELGGVRAYKTDFELYDERTQDAQHAIVEIYIGIFPNA